MSYFRRFWKWVIKVPQTNPEQERRSKLEAEIQALQESEATLKKANARLEQQLKDSGIELDATVYEFLRAKDATEKAKEEAERASLVKSAFLASMSHELRTPLNAIINFTKFVAKGSMGPVNEEQSETLYEVIDSAKHLLSLINDVLDMSKIESGSLSLFIENNVELPAILDTVIRTAKGLLAEKPVTLETDIAPDLPPLRGDRQRILQVLLNIMANACKFTEAGHIKLRARQVDDEIIFAVEDTGPGITLQDQPAVFEAFKQTETGLRQGGGTGLGMPISKNLVEAHGGRLWLESEPGKGTTFFVALPIESAILAPTLVSPVGVAS
jgi:signal transduction histidine kinase